ncbi:hypothetical protein O9K51_08785 [Purpureocillium lavendulum]|uniref:Uncharacterized protein n=1 Tax=Purpureocillium lavendulum TaxID=1247861 RepID=A0AB34FGN2_9HYPO|nr:hypothetical protein O9K51_08785 [Purpureocillium lavendulum]
MGFALVPDVGSTVLSAPAALVYLLLRWWYGHGDSAAVTGAKTPAEHLREARVRAGCDPDTGSPQSC